VLAPDLRGFGDSTRTPDGLDAATLATDIEGLLDGRPATVVAIDAGVPAAVLLALRRPDLGLATAGAVRFSTAAAMASGVSIWSSTVSPLDQRRSRGWASPVLAVGEPGVVTRWLARSQASCARAVGVLRHGRRQAPSPDEGLRAFDDPPSPVEVTAGLSAVAGNGP